MSTPGGAGSVTSFRKREQGERRNSLQQRWGEHSQESFGLQCEHWMDLVFLVFRWPELLLRSTAATRQEKGISVVNIDETAMLVSIAQKAWTYNKRDATEVLVSSSVQTFCITCTLAVFSAPGHKMIGQVIYEGTTERCLPKGVVPENSVCHCSTSHWQMQQTLLEFVQRLDQEFDVRWVLLWDCAPAHCARDFVIAVAEQRPKCTLAYVPCGTTSVCQPLDRFYFESFQSSLREVFHEGLAMEVLSSFHPIKPMCKTDIQYLSCYDSCRHRCEEGCSMARCTA
eukprot:1007776-Amphidinium_carterae.1